MFKTFKCYSLLILIFFITIQAEASEEQRCSDCNVLEEFINKLSSKDLAHLLIAQKKEEVRTAIIQASGRAGDSRRPVKQVDKNNTEKEDSYFQVKRPIPLTEEELKKSARQRIKEKFIGKLPDRADQFISYFTDHEYYVENNIKLPNRLLLAGMPGVGKTYLFKVLAQELQLPSLSFSASDFADKYIGEASKKIRKVFEIAKELNEPVLIFIDEIDALAVARTDRMHEESRKTLITLLTEIQDLQDNKNIIIICATNDEKSLDPAFKNRFPGQSSATLSPPGLEERTALFMKFFKDNSMQEDLKLAQRLAEVTADHPKYWIYFSVRELEEIVMSAKFAQVQDCKDNQVCDKHICAYMRKAIDATAKYAHYSFRDTSWFGKKETYCDGI